MSDRSLDQEVAQNEMLCESILRWKNDAFDDEGRKLWRDEHGERMWGTPSFTTWSDAGRLLRACAELGGDPDVSFYDKKWFALIGYMDTQSPEGFEDGPRAVRAAAIEFMEHISDE